ncbi:MAG: DNA polymerase III subunit delta [Anaerolineae bacterium]|nr:DNA polymerase III subunit delta [Anaerolineae bacterium]
MSGRNPTFYVLHGTDEFSRRAQVDAMRAQMGDPATAELNITVLDGKNASVADVLSAAYAMPFLSDKRLVLVYDMLKWLSRKGGGKVAKEQVTELVEALPQLPDFARVVFVETDLLSDRNPVLKLAKTAPGGFHKAYNPLNNPAQWITSRARDEYAAEIEPAAVAALASVVEKDLRKADNELAKLAAYVDGQRPIAEADVVLLTPYVPEANIFEMVDAIGRRDGVTASRLLHRLLENDEPLRLFAMIIRQFRLLILAREYLNDEGSPRQIAQAIGVHPFVGEKLSQQARAFTLEQLEAIYHHLLETDLGIKTGKVDDIVALDLLIAGIAT